MDILTKLEILKKRREETEKRIEADRIIVLERRQVSTNNPAIAQLWISFPSSIKPNGILDYYKERKRSYAISANVHEITRIDSFTYFIEIRGVLPMYKWMEYFIASFIQDYGKTGKGYNIDVRGYWDKYDIFIKCFSKTKRMLS